MRRSLTIVAVTVAVLMMVASVPVAADHGGPNEEQTGTNSACIDYLVLWAEQTPHSPLSAQVDVDNDTHFTLSQSGGGPEAQAYVDFYTADGSWIDVGSGEGQVPTNAEYGLICVGLTGVGWPAELPAPEASWTYQDGYLHVDSCDSPFC